MKGILTGWTRGLIGGLIIFGVLDYFTTTNTEKQRFAIFKAGYFASLADVQTELKSLDTVNVTKDTVLNLKVEERIKYHWEGLQDVIKKGEE